MDLSNIDNLMAAATVAGHIVLLLVLARRKMYREFPIFTAYIVFLTLVDPVVLLVMRLAHISSAEMAGNPIYFRTYFAVKVPEYLLELGVLFEIGRGVLQPVKRSLPAGSLAAFAVLLVLGGGLTYFLAAHEDPRTLLSRMGSIFVTVLLTMAILRIVCFTVIALFAQMLGIGWKNHVLQLATGLAFYGAVDLIANLAHAHIDGSGTVSAYHVHFRRLDEIRVIGYLSTLTFWCWSFARKEAPRREFSPQMAKFLVSISGAAKRNRSQFGR